MKLRTFDISSMPRNSSVFIYGMIRSGKSVLCKDIMSHFQDIPNCVVVNHQTYLGYQEYDNVVSPKQLVYDTYNKSVANHILQHQEVDDSKETMIVLEDALFDPRSWKTDEITKRFIETSHKHNMFFILASRYFCPAIYETYTSFDYIFLFKDIIPANQRRLFSVLKEYIPSFEVFKYLMELATNNNGCLVIDLRMNTANWEERVYHYRVTNPDKAFTIGSGDWCRPRL